MRSWYVGCTYVPLKHWYDILYRFSKQHMLLAGLWFIPISLPFRHFYIHWWLHSIVYTWKVKRYVHMIAVKINSNDAAYNDAGIEIDASDGPCRDVMLHFFCAALIYRHRLSYWMWPPMGKPGICDPCAICAMHVFSTSSQKMSKLSFFHV